MTNNRQLTIIGRTTLRAVLLGLISAPLAVSLAAKPGGGGTPPPVPDIAYMSPSGSSGSPGSASVRGMRVTAAGAISSDSALWAVDDRFFGAITWDPDGSSLVWEQMTRSKGTRYRALVVGTTGGSIRTIWRFLNTDTIGSQNANDKLAWGRGCNGNTVIVFPGMDYSTWEPVLWAIDPNATTPTPQRLHVLHEHARPEGGPALSSGIAFSPLGGHLVLADYSLDLGRDVFMALPLTCAAGGSLPVAAGPPQPLFAIEYDGGTAWPQSLDWSGDGRRLAVAMGPYENLQGHLTQYDTRIWVGELNYSAAGGAEQITAASATMYRVTSGPIDASSDTFPSWAPSPSLAACDRLAYAKDGSIVLLDVPREGFSATDCSIAVPKVIGGQSAAALDWK